MRSLSSYWISFIAILALAVFPARADYHYASHEGSDEYPYTSWETAALVIQDAVDAADGGDTIYVGAGDYHQRVILNADSLALIGMGMDSTRIWYDVNYWEVIVVDSMATISDIFVEHTADFINAIYAGIFSSVVVERCRFEGGGVFGGPKGTIRNCIFNGPHSWVGNGIGDNYLEVSNCRFNVTEHTPISSRADTNIITNNIIRVDGTNIQAGISLAVGQVYDYVANNLVVIRGPVYGMETAPQNEGLSIVNNTVDTLYRWQFEAWYGILVSRDSVSATLANNTITGGEIAGIGSYGIDKTIYASYNNLWGNSQDFSVPPSSHVDTTFGILRDYPMFVGNGDYHLQAFSPLIDAGDPDILDVDGSPSDIGFYGGPAGESYGYVDLPPGIPEDLSAEVDFDEGIIYLNWQFNHEADFNRYPVYRDTVSGFEPSIFNIIAEPESSYYADADWTPDHDYYYRISSVDDQDNMSDYSEELEVILTSIWGEPGVERPKITAITSSYPNPFNSQTTIVYHVADIGPIPAQINIDIYDIMGRKVRELVDERKEIGSHTITWDGRNDARSDCPSGVYFARISQWGEPRLSSKRKLVLLR